MQNNSENNKNISFQKKKLPWPGIFAGIAVIGISVLVAWSSTVEKQPANNKTAPEGNISEIMNNVRLMTGKDHIRGNSNAPIILIEFSDTECPFCKSFHITLKKIVTDYNGQVAWVYRHFPIDGLHIKAKKEAEATECARELAGDGMFWVYLDRIFEITPSNDQLDPEKLPEIAESIGLNKEQFKQCLDSGKYSSYVSENISDGMSSGVTGTPHTILVAQNGKKIEIRGAQPYEKVKSIIDSALKEK